MGREIRCVPPNYVHPKYENPYRGLEDQPMHDKTFADAVAEWKAGYAAWESGQRPDTANEDEQYWEWEGMPPEDRAMYRTYSKEEATWYQVWQTVSEGTPVSPPFATLDELAAYLAEHGDFWDQKRGNGGWGIDAANRFCKAGWAVSFISAPETGLVAGKLVS